MKAGYVRKAPHKSYKVGQEDTATLGVKHFTWV